jgi:AraC family transcriptional regulator of adaptative response / DNA-3-methyladenine glycosylase II
VLDFDFCYRAVSSRDARFDGWFFVGVTSTGIYCRPSCPATTPKPQNVRFLATAAAAQRAGFRACKRCRPDATPGSPEWNQRSDVIARAMRLIADGVVDRDGVDGLARRLGYSTRQLHRTLVAEVGAGPLALARAQRAQTARVLVETTDLNFAHVAFASGFGSIRQFNDTVREIFGVTPSVLRRARRAREIAPGSVALRLPYREPFAADAVFEFLAARAIPGVEAATGGSYRRSVRLPHGTGTVELRPAPGYISCHARLDDMRDLTTVVARSRRLLDLDADPAAVDDVLGSDPVLGPWARKAPGLRVPGAMDGDELALRAVLGQQVSVRAANRLAGRLAVEHGEPFDGGEGITRLFPTAAQVAGIPPDALPLPRSRAATVQTVAAALAGGDIVVDGGVDRERLGATLLSCAGVGRWTADYVVLRGTGDPDRLLASDLGVRRALRALGVTPDQSDTISRRWRPWRSYAVVHLWRSLS